MAGRKKWGLLALSALLLISCDSTPPSKDRPEAVVTASPTSSASPTTGPAVVSCRALEVPGNKEINTNLDREGGLLDFSYYVAKLQRDRHITFRYRDDPWCRRNPETRRLIFHVGAGKDILGCLDLPPEPPSGMTRIELWFTDLEDPEGYGSLVVVLRDILATMSVARATLEAWIEGPTREEKGAGALPTAPDGTELRGIDIDADTATVDLSEDFERSGLGTTYEGAIVEALAGTLTQFEGVDRGLLKIEGEFKDYYMGHGFIIDRRHPLVRPRPKGFRVAETC